MGWLDFLKKKKEVVEETKEINPSEAEKLIEKKLSEEKEKVENIKKELDRKIEKFILEIGGEIKTLDLINLENKKESDRIKEIVLHSLKEYIIELKRLIENLNKIKGENISSYFNKIDLTFDFFSKNSEKKLQKATFLIGKEIKEVENKIKAFYREIHQIFQESKKTIEIIKNIQKIENLKNLHLELREKLKKANEIIFGLEKEKKTLDIKKDKKEKEIYLFKESVEFKEWIIKKEEIRKESEKLKDNINLLKEKINLKSLLKKFHEIGRVRILIKNYREDFLKGLKNDSELELAGMLKKEDADELKKIAEKISRLKKEKELYSMNEKEEKLNKNLKEVEKGIEDINQKIEEENRKVNKFNEKEKILQKEIIGMSEEVLENVKII